MRTHDDDKAARSPRLPSQLPAEMPTSSFAEMSLILEQKWKNREVVGNTKE